MRLLTTLADRVGNSQDPLVRLTGLMALSAPSPPTTKHGGEQVAPRPDMIHTDRIARTTAELRATAGPQIDSVDAALMQMLLNDYRNAVAQLRHVVADAEHRLSSAALPIREGHHLFERLAAGKAPKTSRKPKKTS